MQIDTTRYLGLSELEATALAVANGFQTVRIIARDRTFYIVTRDLRTDRLNLRLEDGLVTRAFKG